MTISTSATPGHFSAVVVVTGSFGVYGNLQGPFWANGPYFYAENAGTYSFDLDATAYPDGVSNGFWGGQQQSGGPYSGQANIIIPAWTAPAPDPQTVTVTPSSSSVSKGNPLLLTASGGHNDYIWSVSGGGGIVASGASATATFTTAGTYEVRVYSVSGNGYNASNTAVCTVTVENSKRVSIPLYNPADHPVKFRLYQDGVLLGETILSAGQRVIASYNVPSSSPVIVKTLDDYMQPVGPIYIVNDHAVTPEEKTVASITPSTADPTPPAPEVTPPPTPKTEPTPASDKTVWGSITNANKDSTVTAIQSAEGTDKVVSAVSAQTTDLKAAATAQTAAILTAINSTHGQTDTLDTSSVSDGSATVQTADVDTLIGKLPSAPTFVSPEANVTSTTFNLSFITGENMASQDYPVTFDFSSWVERLAWLRLLIKGVLSIFLFFAISKQLRDSVAN